MKNEMFDLEFNTRVKNLNFSILFHNSNKYSK